MDPLSFIRLAFSLALPFAILYFLSVRQERAPEGLHSAYRLALKIVLACVLLALIPQVRSYADLVIQSSRNSRSLATRQGKLSAADLESSFARANRFAPNADLRCKPVDRDWDYVCGYMPTPLQSHTRLEFGVSVDEKGWVDVSRIVPAGTIIPPTRPR